MLLTKEVEVLLNGSNIKYYEKLGYKIIRERDKHNNYVVKVGSKIKVKIEDVPLNSHIDVDYYCDYCFKDGERTKLSISYIKYNHKHKNIPIDCCDKCKYKKQKDVMNWKYSDAHPNKIRLSCPKNIHKYDDLFNSKNIIALEDTYIYIDDILPFKCKIHDCLLDNFSIQKIQQRIIPCPICLREYRSELWREDESKVFSLFYDNDLVPLDNEKYINSLTPIKCICNKHPNIIQEITYFNLKSQYGGCRLCINENIKGEGNHNWKGGITSKNQIIRNSEEYKNWRLKVFEHDNYTCQCCGDNKGGNLNAHHIENFSSNEELRFDIENGITLCNKCHDFRYYGSFHHTYGSQNNTREQLEEYFIKFNNGELNDLRNKNIS